MSVKGSRDYCYYCRREEKLLLLHQNVKVCEWCRNELNNRKKEINYLQMRFSNELEKFLLKICMERKRTIPNEKRCQNIFLCSIKKEMDFEEKIKQSLKKHLKCRNVDIIKKSSNFIYYTEKEVVFVREEQKKKELWSFKVIGRIKLTEIYSILK